MHDRKVFAEFSLHFYLKMIVFFLTGAFDKERVTNSLQLLNYELGSVLTLVSGRILIACCCWLCGGGAHAEKESRPNVGLLLSWLWSF